MAATAAPEVPEESRDLSENAIAKARAFADHFGVLAVADDTGLYVDALDGRPGPRAARYAGPGATDADRVARLLEELRGIPPQRRTARFRCAIAVAEPGGGRVWTFEGTCEGYIAPAPAGRGGFGYDPIFVVPEVGKAFAQLSMAEKNRLSHRAQAWRQAQPLLVDLLIGGVAGGRGAGA